LDIITNHFTTVEFCADYRDWCLVSIPHDAHAEKHWSDLWVSVAVYLTLQYWIKSRTVTKKNTSIKTFAINLVIMGSGISATHARNIRQHRRKVCLIHTLHLLWIVRMWEFPCDFQCINWNYIEKEKTNLNVCAQYFLNLCI
jgi:hypothetical protein